MRVDVDTDTDGRSPAAAHITLSERERTVLQLVTMAEGSTPARWLEAALREALLADLEFLESDGREQISELLNDQHKQETEANLSGEQGT